MQVAGRYSIVRFVAAGGMSDVYEAEDLLLGTKVALKAVKPAEGMTSTAVQRLVREIALARKVSHPNVRRVYDVGEHAGRAFLTMEFLVGETLADRLRRRPLAADERETIAAQLIAGLAALHAHEIIHRDFKSSNVMLTGDGDRLRAVVSDFGLAKSTVIEPGPELTAGVTLLGSPSYMAPEQVDGGTATIASDIYALGVVLFEMVTGTLPFREATPLQTAVARLTHDAPRARDRWAGVPARWDDAIARCLERDPARRPAKVGDVFAPIPHRRRLLLRATGVLAVAVLALVPRDRSDAVVERTPRTCATAASKLIGIWDTATRARIEARFDRSGKPFVRSAWRGHAAQFDEMTRQWATLWDDACKADDQISDPLLYGQRLSCLEANLAEVRAFASALDNPAIDVEAFARGSPGQFPLVPPAACSQEAFLRGQVPLPPLASRPAVDAVMAEFHHQRSQARLATTGAIRVDLEGVFHRLGELERRAGELGYAAGVEEIQFWHGVFLLWFGRLDEAHDLASRITALAQQTRDDAHVVLGRVLDVHAHVRRPGSYDAKAAEVALADASQAASRLGNPPHLLEWIEEARVQHLFRIHRVGVESRLRLATLRAELNATSYALWARGELALVRAWNGDPARALVEARAVLREREQLQGSSAILLADDRVELSSVFALAGDVGGARDQVERAIEIYSAAWGEHQSIELWRARMHAAGYGAQLGDRAAAERQLRAAIEGAVRGGASRPDAYARAVQTLRQFGHRGAAELAVRLAERAGVTSAALQTARRELDIEIDDRVPPAMAPLGAHVRWNAPERGELEARRGLALAAAGDPAAVAHLEEAIWIYGSCCAANAVIAQDARLALADIRWRAGDRESARQLATLARDRLATMGPALEAKRHAAEQWLTAH